MQAEGEDGFVAIPIEDVLDLHPFRPARAASVVAEYVAATTARASAKSACPGRGIGVQRGTGATLERSSLVTSFGDAAPREGGGRDVVRSRDRLMSQDDFLLTSSLGAGAPASRSGRAVPVDILTARVLRARRRGEAHSFSIRKFYAESEAVTANYKGFPAVCTGVLCLPDPSKGETLTYLDRAIQDHRLVVRYGEAVGSIRRSVRILPRGADAARIARTCAIAFGILGRPQKPELADPPSLKDVDLLRPLLRAAPAPRTLVVGGGTRPRYAQYLAQEGRRVVLSYRGTSFRRMNDINRTSLAALEDGPRGVLRGLERRGG